jgi:hypothetical protein
MADEEKTPAPAADAQPGQVIAPGGRSASEPAPFQAETPYTDALTQPEKAEATAASVSWTASEFIAHEKSAGWYVNLFVVALLLAGLIFLATRDFISAGVILFGALMFGFYGARQPRQLSYRVDAQGIQIGEKTYAYEEFRSFAVVPEGVFSSIVFVPLKRFGPLISIYYDPKDEANIVNILADRLPYEERKHDPIDSFQTAFAAVHLLFHSLNESMSTFGSIRIFVIGLYCFCFVDRHHVLLKFL